MSTRIFLISFARVRLIFVLLLGLLVAQSSSANAKEENSENMAKDSSNAESEGGTVASHFKGSMGFFTDRSLITVFSTSPESNPAPELGDLQEARPEDKSKRLENKQNQRGEKKIDSRTKIIETFGDPSEVGKKISLDHLPKEAPPALRGFVAALNIGDRKLAEEYARAYGEYHKTLQRYLRAVSEVTKAHSDLEDRGLIEYDVAKLPESLRKDLQKNVVEKVDVELEQLKDALLKPESTIKEEELINPSTVLGLKNIIRYGSLEDLELAADEIIRSNDIADTGYVVFILLRSPSSTHILRAGSIYTELAGAFHDGAVNAVIVCTEGCTSKDVATLRGFYGANVLSNHKSLAESLNQKQDFEVVIVGNTTGKTYKISESNPRFLRILLSRAIKR